MKCSITSNLAAPVHTVWARVRRSDTLHYVTWGVMGFSPANGFPDEWHEGATETTRILVFGWIPAWQHDIAFTTIDDAGLLTPAVWLFAHMFFRYRQWRWISLLRQGD